MKTLNERIQDLRNILVTCYNTIKRKGGTIPEAGERNMSNLPDAVLSIPQVHSELTELTVTANGEYLPADYNVDGFSKVTAKFDTSSLPKVKIKSLSIGESCLGDGGIWDGNGIDWDSVESLNRFTYFRVPVVGFNINNWKLINCKDFNQAFATPSLLSIDTSKWSLSGNIVFSGCFMGSNLVDLYTNWNISPSTIQDMLNGCINLKKIDTRMWDMSTCSNLNRAF